MSTHGAATLNTLLILTRDGAEDFDEAAKLVENLKIKSLLEKAAEHCRKSEEELAAIVAKLGEQPERHASLTGTLHVAWTELRSRIGGLSDAEILDECLRDEAAALDAFERALGSDIPTEAQALVEKHYRGVRQHYEMVRGLRCAFEIARG
jgi:uncharacterized protein (TIGR02284 family)